MRTAKDSPVPPRRPRLRRTVAGWIVTLAMTGAAVSGLASETFLTQAGARPEPAAKVSKKVADGRPLIRQLWVWQFGTPEDLIRLAQNTRVTQLLVWVSPRFSKDPTAVDRLRRLVQSAAAEKIAVVALCGDPSWAVNAEAAGVWAREVAATGLFTRLHLDIEPNALADWSTHVQSYSRGLLEALDKAQTAGLPLSADIPAWFNTIKVGGRRLDTAVIRRVSDITVMAYRSTTEAVLTAARPEVTEAARLHKSAYIGVNIGPTGGDPPSTSMLGRPAETVFRQLSAVDDRASTWAGYRGLAVHDSVYLAKLANAA